MRKVKELSEDIPQDYLKTAIWWTEFVIRHKGAPHLRTSIVDDPWYKKYDMDVIAVLSITTFVTLFYILVIMYKLLKVIFMHFTRTPIYSKIKIN